ncbi:hypothetical protein [Rhizobium leguminosarum]|uniref:hypothetical protein n=1 Tax=Rhizobium leguminosarum TaxID=384 RepID=UPI001FE04313|nr:hypothetical protein [Rhizobium leguminosarum]
MAEPQLSVRSAKAHDLAHRLARRQLRNVHVCAAVLLLAGSGLTGEAVHRQRHQLRHEFLGAVGRVFAELLACG